MKYNLVICGGTFDRVHAGHKAFLRFAFSHGNTVVIGLTSDMYVAQNKKDESILPFAQRKKELQDFLSLEGFFERAKIVAIDSRFDQTKIPDASSIALLVSQETEKIGKEINAEREKLGLTPLHLLVFPLVATPSGEKISSSTIRSGRITREGVLLPDNDFLSTTLFLPDSLREILHKPFGMLFAKDIPKQFLKNPQRIVTVGDVTTKRIHDKGIQQKIAVVDFFIERKKTNQSLSQLGFMGNEKIVHLVNSAGQLVPRVWKKLLSVVSQKQSKKSTIIIVEGEEDLFVIPLILMLPLGDLLMYGQPSLGEDGPQEGIVILEITENLKQKTFEVLKQFVPK
ncbi:MAG TPA: pantetheine-phosphate adenylyltransferase [Candidatus Eisenbacteria bacterium]|nr:pantetheine-phosphate adenylyltransferase [Candidatus Eisenbacteria bacterium]